MVSDAPKHYPVLLNEIISIITPQHGGTFIDCTFGELIVNLKLKNENIRGILFDLGYSYTQIKDPKKGLSFNSVGDLNMQMGLNEFSARDVINNLDVHELEKIFKFFGEELEAKKIASNIVKERKKKKLIQKISQIN